LQFEFYTLFCVKLLIKANKRVHFDEKVFYTNPPIVIWSLVAVEKKEVVVSCYHCPQLTNTGVCCQAMTTSNECRCDGRRRHCQTAICCSPIPIHIKGQSTKRL